MSHRFQLACAAKAAGYRVIVVTQVGDHTEAIQAAGLELLPIRFARSHARPWQDAKTIWSIFKLYRQVKPDLVHHVAIKPVLYGSFAAFFARVPVVINALTGLGYAFSSDQRKAVWIRRAILPLFKFIFSGKGRWLILQNPDDQQTLSDLGVLRADRTVLIRGSGVDSQQFQPSTMTDEIPIVMLASRLLKDKGVIEFVQAATQLIKQGIKCRFVLVGDSDPENPSSIQTEQLQRWDEQGMIEWWGRRTDMYDVLPRATIVCLPSYREGLPKVLIEAAACGKALITTDAPGCREVVRDGENGLLVPPRDADALAGAIQTLLADPELIMQMGKQGRVRVEAEFTIQRVIEASLSLYARALNATQKSQGKS